MNEFGSLGYPDCRSKQPNPGPGYPRQAFTTTKQGRYLCATLPGHGLIAQAQKRAESLSRSLLCWKWHNAGREVEGFEDDPITIVRVGHSGTRPSQAIERRLSRWLGRIMAEDQQRLELDQRRRRRARSQEAYERWLRQKEAALQQAEMMQAEQSRLLAASRERQRPSREQCDQHYEAWCRRYDAQRATAQPARPASSEEEQLETGEPVARYIPVTFGAEDCVAPFLWGSTQTKRPTGGDNEFKGKEDKLVYEHAITPSTENDGEEGADPEPKKVGRTRRRSS
eukprot:s73_g7.t1